MRIGVDLLEIARFGRIAAHPTGRRIVFSATELAHADALGEPRREEYLAAASVPRRPPRRRSAAASARAWSGATSRSWPMPTGRRGSSSAAAP